MDANTAHLLLEMNSTVDRLEFVYRNTTPHFRMKERKLTNAINGLWTEYERQCQELSTRLPELFGPAGYRGIDHASFYRYLKENPPKRRRAITNYNPKGNINEVCSL